MLIAQDTCSNENKISVQNFYFSLKYVVKSIQIKKNQHCTSASFPVVHNQNTGLAK